MDVTLANTLRNIFCSLAYKKKSGNDIAFFILYQAIFMQIK